MDNTTLNSGFLWSIVALFMCVRVCVSVWLCYDGYYRIDGGGGCVDRNFFFVISSVFEASRRGKERERERNRLSFEYISSKRRNRIIRFSIIENEMKI